MELNRLTFWHDISVIVVEKGFYHDIKKNRGAYAFHKSYGAIPVGSYNKITGKFEDVVNTRGRAYAARRRKCYRKKMK